MNNIGFYLITTCTLGSVFMGLSVILFYFRFKTKFIAQQEELLRAERDHRQQLMNSVIQSQENERTRISKDLHDHVGSSLSSLRLMASQIKLAAPDHHRIHVITEEYKVQVDKVIDDIRNISHSLSPAGLALWGFQETLEQFCEKMALAAGLEIQAIDKSDGILKQLPFDSALSLFRVLQELLSNTIKHASAQKITITTFLAENCVVVSYYDDGRGTDANIFKSKGIGMYNIESRLSMIMATHEFSSAPGSGFTFNIKLKFNTLNKTALYA